MQIKVGEVIKAKREERNVSLAGAREVGISPGYLSQLERQKIKSEA